MAEWEGSPVANSSAQSKIKQDAVTIGCAGNKRHMQLRNWSVVCFQLIPETIKQNKHVEGFWRICLDTSSTLDTSTIFLGGLQWTQSTCSTRRNSRHSSPVACSFARHQVSQLAVPLRKSRLLYLSCVCNVSFASYFLLRPNSSQSNEVDDLLSDHFFATLNP